MRHLLFLLILATQSHASLIVHTEQGGDVVTHVTGVELRGQFYDVAFIAGTFSDVYPDRQPLFFDPLFNENNGARGAMVQVLQAFNELVPVPLVVVDDSINEGNFAIAKDGLEATSGDVGAVYSNNFEHSPTPEFPRGRWLLNEFGPWPAESPYRWAVFTPAASIPEPSAYIIWLMLGLTTVGSCWCRRRRT